MSAGNINDNKMVEELLEEINIKGTTVLADKAYSTKAVRKYMEEREAKYCIPPKKNYKNKWEYDEWQYKERHLIENFFQKLKNCRRISTRYDRLAERYLSFIYLGCICILLK